jgi:hypothetical protein
MSVYLALYAKYLYKWLKINYRLLPLLF